MPKMKAAQTGDASVDRLFELGGHDLSKLERLLSAFERGNRREVAKLAAGLRRSRHRVSRRSRAVGAQR